MTAAPLRSFFSAEPPAWPPALNVPPYPPAATLFQAWRAHPEPGYLPANVWLTHCGEALHVTAVLEDADIFNSARGENQPTWTTGDVFEIFLRPEGQEAYYEFHVTPENHTLRLRFPSVAFRQAMARQFPHDPAWVFDLSLPPSSFQSASRVEAHHHRWIVTARVPFSTVLENGDSFPLRPWRVSFCRYDATRGTPGAVLSSTSPYPEPRFHEIEHWLPLHFINTG